jgi:glycosyltransferase involved in cell wall biosynthesis
MNNGKTLVMLVYDVNNSFIINELKFYDKHKIPVRLYTRSTPEELGFIPSCIEVNTITDAAISAFSIGVRNGLWFMWECACEVFRNLRNPGYLKQAWKEIMAGLQSLKTALFIRSMEKSSANKIFYSYWFYHEATVLSWLKKIGFTDVYVSRAHAFDIYEDHRPNKVMPFREFQLKQATAVFPVSEDGTMYLRTRYPSYKSKIRTLKLGITNDISPDFYPSENLKIISCGSVQKRKRTNLIYEAVRDIPGAEWTHIGDGPQMDEYFGKLGQSTCKVRPLGALNNEAVFREFQVQKFNVFISLSENEGIPVSIMEAISFGVPVISTDAGGCREIVNAQTGVLIPVDFDMEALKTILNGFMDSAMNTPEFREGVYRFWERNFNAENNYKAFLNTIMQ